MTHACHQVPQARTRRGQRVPGVTQIMKPQPGCTDARYGLTLLHQRVKVPPSHRATAKHGEYQRVSLWRHEILPTPTLNTRTTGQSDYSPSGRTGVEASDIRRY